MAIGSSVHCGVGFHPILYVSQATTAAVTLGNETKTSYGLFYGNDSVFLFKKSRFPIKRFDMNHPNGVDARRVCVGSDKT